MAQPRPSNLEFSYLVEVSTLPAGGRWYKFAASEEECTSVAARLELKELSNLKVAVQLTRTSGGFVNVAGHVEADVVQICVVTLAPISVHVREDISMVFMEEVSAAASKKHDGAEELISVDDDDPPELVIDGRIDLGELAVEQLVLALDPYPRAPGVKFGAKTWGSEGGAEAASGGKPFAALEKLKNIKPH